MLDSMHEHFMRIAMGLAEKGRGFVSPNPLVGAVIVKGNRLIATGAHLGFGGAHAEIEALRRAGSKAKGATLYVTLEPCSTWGKTGPCTEAILRFSVKDLIVGAVDPNPKHKGRGIRLLRRAGLRVTVGVLTKEILNQNAGFVSLMTKGRPHVTLKMAQSLDGKISTRCGESRWITSGTTRQFVHRLRANSDGILVGTETVLNDNPLLTARNSEGGKFLPARIVLDRRLRVTPSARVFRLDGAPVYYVTSRTRLESARKRLPSHVRVLGVKESGYGLDIHSLLAELGRIGLATILIEGGGELAASFVEQRLVDKIVWCLAPKLIGGRNAKTSLEGKGFARLESVPTLRYVKIIPMGGDVIIEGEL